MCIVKKFLLIIFIIGSFFYQKVNATDNFIPIRVGISDTLFKNYVFDSIEFINANNLKVMDSSTGYYAPLTDNVSEIKVTVENKLFRIYIDNELCAKNLTGPILISSKDNNFIDIKNLKRKGTQASYRGYIELAKYSKDDSKFAVVNILSLKNYLRGVVPNEMPVRFGLEALKAQTVAARNYAVTPRVRAYNEFDVCDSVACQVYYGANTENELSDKAIDQTNGVIALDKENNPILALYSSTAGGYTESYEFAFSDPQTREFPSKNIHYLTPVPDKEYFEPMEDDETKAEAFYTSKPESFDDQSPYYRWTKEWTLSEMEDMLKKTLPAQSKTGFISPEINSADDIGKLESIKVLKRGISGKIISLQIRTDKNTFEIKKELVIRRCFQKNGISLPSANFIVNYISAETPVYQFLGGGFGHGVGLSQWGAGKMSSLGYTYDEILQHYYQGIKLATIPIDIYDNDKFIERHFYTEHDEAYIYIINNEKLEHLKVKINDEELDISLNSNFMKVDISDYLKKGSNKIAYMIVNEKPGYSKKVSIFVEVKGSKDE